MVSHRRAIVRQLDQHALHVGHHGRRQRNHTAGLCGPALGGGADRQAASDRLSPGPSTRKGVLERQAMYAAVSTFTLKPGSFEAVERVARQQAALIKSQSGCQWIAFVKISEDKLVLLQTWDTEQHLEDARTATMGKGAAELGDVLVSREAVQGEVIAW